MALFAQLRHKQGWTDEETKAAAQAIIDEEDQKYKDFLDKLPPEWQL